MTEPNQESQRQPRNRYPGARPFTDSPEDQQIFFGREADIDRLFERVVASKLLVMSSKSGLGKTSLLMAGLFPKLRREKALLPVPIRINAPGTPADIVIEAVTEECKRAGVELTSGNTAGVWEFLLSSLIWSRDLLLTPVLVFDQFEEIFTLRDSAFRTALASELGALASALPPERLRTADGGPLAHHMHLAEHAPDVKILLSLREEYVGTLQELSVHIPGLFQERFTLAPLGENEARVAICGPAERIAGPQDAPFATPTFTYDPDALQELLRFLQGRSGVIESFQLQLLCHRAEEIIAARAKLIAAATKEAAPPAAADITFRISRNDLGGSAGMQEVLKQFYQNAIGKLRWRDQRRARRLCEEGLLSATGSRIMLHEAQIRSDYGVKGPALKVLVNEHLLRREQRLESPFYEISHDQLASSIEKSRPFRIPRKYRQMIYGALVVGFFTIGTLLYSYYLVTKQRQIATWQMLALEAQRQTVQTGDDDLAGLLARQAWLIHGRLTGQQINLIDDSLRSVLPTDNVRHILRAHTAAVLSVAFGPAEADGQKLASGGFDGTVRLWDLGHPEKKPTQLELPEGAVRSVAINRTGTMLAAGSENGKVHVWHLDDPNQQPVELPLPQQQQHSGRVRSVAFSPVNGEQLASAGVDGKILIWDLRHPEGDPVVLQEGFDEIRSVVFDPKGELLVSGGIDGKVRIWTLSNRDKPVTLPSGPGGEANPIVSLAFNADGTKLAVGRKDGKISVSDLREPQPDPVPLNNDVMVVSVTFSPDGRYLASAHDGKIRLWDLRHPEKKPTELELPAGQGIVRSVAFSPDGERLASGGEDAAVRIWELHKMRPTVLAGSGQAAVHSVAFSPNGEKVAWGDYDGRVGRVRISDPRNPGAEAGVLPGIAEGDVFAIAFSPDGKKMASGSEDSIVRIWDLGALQRDPVELAAPPGRAVWSVAFSPDSDHLAAGTADGTLRVWDLHTLQEAPVDLRDPEITNDVGVDSCEESQWPKADAYTVAFSRNKNQLVAGYADGMIRIWDLGHPEAPPKKLDANIHDYVCSVVFTADGRLVSGNGDNSIRIWDLTHADTRPLTLTGHTANVLSVAVSPDGTRLASASEDKQIRIWLLQEILKLGEPRSEPIVLKGHDGAVFSVAFDPKVDPKGSTLISASADKTVRVWQQSPALAENVCSWVWRNLSMSEWRRWIGEGLPYECTCPKLPRGADVPADAPAEHCQKSPF